MMETRLHAQPKTAPPPSLSPVFAGVLQRKCACGGSAGLTKECGDCGKQGLSLQRSTENSGHPLDTTTRPFLEPGFGHDFSRVRVDVSKEETETIGQLLPVPTPSPRADQSKLSESGSGDESEDVTKDPASAASGKEEAGSSHIRSMRPQPVDSETPLILFKVHTGSPRADYDTQTVQAGLGIGSPLDSGVRSRMESAFGHDFSRVRVQNDHAAAGLANQLSARAFTIGSNIAFAAGEYHPGTPVGDKLLAHELAHVVQQEGATVGRGPVRIGRGEYNSMEADADRTSTQAIVSLQIGEKAGDAPISRKALPQLRSGLSLQRQPAAPTYGVTPEPMDAGKAAKPKSNCKLKSGPTYSPSGTIKATKAGGKKNAAFDLSAEFENDPNTGADASCCQVRQYILWTKAADIPNNDGYKPAASFKDNTWYEDRDTVGKRYGHRTGPYSECVGINHYEDAAAKKDCANGAIFKGHDAPMDGSGAKTGEWQFKLKAIDTCDGEKDVGTAATVTVDWNV